MPSPRRSSTLRGSKAAAGPSEKSRLRAANQGAYKAGQNATTRGVSRVGRQASAPAPTPTRSKPPRGMEMVDEFRRRGYGALGRPRR